MSDDPSKTLPAVDAMRQDWDIVDPLMGGTTAMREAGERLLPKWPMEEDCAYKERLSQSTLFPAYSETVKNNTGRVFAEPIVLGDDLPAPIEEYTENFDRQGNNLQVWAKSLFTVALSHGLCHVLVEYPKTTDDEGNPTIVTKADEKAAKVRPYVVMIKPQQVIGWRSNSVDGEHVLTQFRYMESVEEDDGVFGTKCVDQVRVLEPGKWTTYRKTESTDRKAEWVQNGTGNTSLSVIPLATFYTNRTGFMTAKPPLLELAHLNVKHWRSESDQYNLLHIARVPILVIINGDDDTKVVVGANAAMKLPKDADMKFVEHTGKAIDAGRTSLLDLEEQMHSAGAKLLKQEKQATMTATQAEEEAAQEMSPLQTMAGQLEDTLDQVLQFFADFIGEKEGGHVQVQGNFDIDFAPETTLPLLLNMASQGRLSDETLFSEMQRRNVVSSDIKWDEEKAKIAEQGPSLGAL